MQLAGSSTVDLVDIRVLRELISSLSRKAGACCTIGADLGLAN